MPLKGTFCATYLSILRFNYLRKMRHNGPGIKNVRDFRATILSAVTEFKISKKLSKYHFYPHFF